VGLRELLEDERGAGFATQRELVKTFKAAVGVLELAAPAQKALWSALAVRDEQAPVITDRKGNPEPDPELRDNENVPLPAVPVSFLEDPTERFATPEYRTAVDDYMRDEVLPYVPDAWVDHDRTKLGYEIPLTRHFYKYVPPRPLEEIDGEIKALEDEIQRLLGEVVG
jgi:type I restriction enzyme M protein